ncbi:hypothetical protein ACWCOP_06220 [Maricaulaceae bacterium MS644]
MRIAVQLKAVRLEPDLKTGRPGPGHVPTPNALLALVSAFAGPPWAPGGIRY